MIYFFLITHLLLSASILAKTSIGVIVPIEHEALTQMTAGFVEQLKTLHPNQNDLEITVQNAQGDLSVQRSLMKQMLTMKKVDMIVPIGESATSMALSMARPPQVVLGLAVMMEEEERIRQNLLYMTGVHDEISPRDQLKFLVDSAAIKDFRKAAIIYSGSEKVIPEVSKVELFFQEKKIHLEKRMIQTMPEIYTVIQSLPKDVQLVYILKDFAVVSGIATLNQFCEKRKIVLMASDEGSVKGGACFAVGVSERKIGEVGAKLAAKVLMRDSKSNLLHFPMERVRDYQLFINESYCSQQGFKTDLIKAQALKSRYPVSLL